MSATDELRRLLDERGVEYEKTEDDTTIYYDSDGNRYTYNVNPDSGWAQLFSYNLTPEQAIAATLGSGKLTAEQVEEAVYRNCKFYEGGEVDVESITDELNATLGGGECKVVASSTDGLTTDEPKQWFKLSCGHAFKLYGLDAPVACPVCGKAVKR